MLQALLPVLGVLRAPRDNQRNSEQKGCTGAAGLRAAFSLAKLKVLLLGIVPGSCFHILVPALFLDGSHLPLHLSLHFLPLLLQPGSAFKPLSCLMPKLC